MEIGFSFFFRINFYSSCLKIVKIIPIFLSHFNFPGLLIWTSFSDGEKKKKIHAIIKSVSGSSKYLCFSSSNNFIMSSMNLLCKPSTSSSVGFSILSTGMGFPTVKRKRIVIAKQRQSFSARVCVCVSRTYPRP